jgi:hypothetical protein
MDMDITKRQALQQRFLNRMIKGAGGKEKFDSVLFLFDAYPSYAEEVGKRIFEEVEALENSAIAEDEQDEFSRQMNDVARAKGLNLDDPRNSMMFP